MPHCENWLLGDGAGGASGSAAARLSACRSPCCCSCCRACFATSCVLVLGLVSATACMGADERCLPPGCRRYHPDRNPDKPDAEEKFREIAAAYEVLSGRRLLLLLPSLHDLMYRQLDVVLPHTHSPIRTHPLGTTHADPEKRQMYDRFGEAGLNQQGGGPGGPGGHGGGFHFQVWHVAFAAAFAVACCQTCAGRACVAGKALKFTGKLCCCAGRPLKLRVTPQQPSSLPFASAAAWRPLQHFRDRVWRRRRRAAHALPVSARRHGRR